MWFVYDREAVFLGRELSELYGCVFMKQDTESKLRLPAEHVSKIIIIAKVS